MVNAEFLHNDSHFDLRPILLLFLLLVLLPFIAKTEIRYPLFIEADPRECQRQNKSRGDENSLP